MSNWPASDGSNTVRRTAGTKTQRWGTIACALIAAGLLWASLKLPLWQMRLEAPQYRDEEALKVAVHPNALRGDLRELTVLDQYIGVHVPSRLPQFTWLPALLIAGGGLGILASLLAGHLRSRALLLVSCAVAAGLAVAALQARGQMKAIGHHRDHRTILVGVKDFTPPFLGSARIAQFTVHSWLGAGAWLVGTALALQVSGAWLSKSKPQKTDRCTRPVAPTEALATVSH